MARKKRIKRATKRRAHRVKRRSGISVSELGGKRRSKRRSPRRYGAISGGGLDSWKRAATASIILRLMRGAAKWGIAKAGINFPMLSIAVPAGVAFASSRNMIKIPGIFPMAVDQTVNALIDHFPALKKAADFDFASTKSGYDQPRGAITPRSYRDTMRAIEARNGLSVTNQPMTYNGLELTSEPMTFNGYTQE